MSEPETVTVSKQWIKYEGKVYMRRKIGLEPWGDWEETAFPEVPFVKLREVNG